MTPVEDVLAKIRHRYLIIGSGALRLHGIDWEEGDLDIWLDPISSMTIGKRQSMMPLVLSSDLGSEASQTDRRLTRIDSHRLFATAGCDA